MLHVNTVMCFEKTSVCVYYSTNNTIAAVNILTSEASMLIQVSIIKPKQIFYYTY